MSFANAYHGDDRSEGKPDSREEDRQGERPAPDGGDSEPEKIVDEDWKARVREEQEQLRREDKEVEEKRRIVRTLRPDFMSLVSGLAAEALIHLGQAEGPAGEKTKVNIDAARYTIDTLQMLEEKTKGNLTQEESKGLAGILHELRLRFVDAAGRKKG